MPVYVNASDLKDFSTFYKTFPERAAQALSLAINDTMRSFILPQAKKEIYSQVNMPDGYLDEDGRLQVEQFATPTQLVGIVAGRDRPTSLARFATVDNSKPASPKGWRKVASVRVNRDGPARKFRNAFIITLRNGNAGFAIRLRAGETLTSVDRFDPKEIYPDVYILYGPSVDQIFQGVAKDIQPEVMEYLEGQFTRQFYRLGQ